MNGIEIISAIVSISTAIIATVNPLINGKFMIKNDSPINIAP